MNASRRCSKTACGGRAIATLTYAYADRAAVLGPLATFAEPHSYDLCADHAQRLTAPQGWDVVRLESEDYQLRSEDDDLAAVVDAVREQQPAAEEPDPAVAEAAVASIAAAHSRRSHLRVVPSHFES